MSEGIQAPASDDLREMLSELVRQTRVPGMALAVSVRGQRASAYVGEAAVGLGRPMSHSSRFSISCMMKFFVSLVSLEMARAGELDVEAPIDEYLAELRRDGSSVPPARVRHLMGHTAGYRGLDITDARTKWGYSWQRFEEHFRAHPQSFTPGTVFNYEHSEHVVLGRILQRLLARDGLTSIRERLFERLGIRPAGVREDLSLGVPFVAEHRFDVAAGRYVPLPVVPFGEFWALSLSDLTISMGELVMILEALIAALRWPSAASPFSAATVTQLLQREITLPAQVASRARTERTPLGFSIGCGHYRNDLLGHNGSMPGQTCAIRFSPTLELALAVGVNAWDPYARDAAIERTFDLCVGETRTHAERPEESAFDVTELIGHFAPGELVGTYYGSYFGTCSVACAESGELSIQFGGTARVPGPRVRALPVAADRYKVESTVPVSIGFFADPTDGRPVLAAGVHAYKQER